MESMFLGGILPAVVMLIATAVWGISVQGPGRKDDAPAFDTREAWRAVWQAKWELLMPVVALGALFGGVATPVEAAALTALYAIVIETVVYRDLKWTSGLPQVLTECGLLMGGVLLIQGVALGFTNYLVDAELMARAAGLGHQHDPFPLGLPAGPESVPVDRRLPDGNLCRHRNPGAVIGNDRSCLRD